MLHRQKQLGFWESIPSLSDGGRKKRKSKRTGLQEVKEGFSKKKSKDLLDMNRQLELFVTQESVLLPSATILSDKLNSCAQDTQRLSAFQRLEADSILRGSACLPFWNELSAAISTGLSWPTLTGSSDLDLNWLDGYVKSMTLNSWFSTTVSSVQNKNLFQICCPSSIASVAGFTDSENTENKLARSYGKNPFKKSQNVSPNSVVKIPVFPCKELHIIWKQWLAAYRWIYNKAIELLVGGFKSAQGNSLDQQLQAIQPEWTKCLGKTRQEAVCSAQSAYRQARKVQAIKPKKERGAFKMRFRSCRDKSQVIQFKNDAYRDGTWFPSKVKGLLYCTAWGYQFPDNCEYGTELVYQRGQWFACFPKYVPVNGTGSDKVIAFDPGNRIFLTGYDGENILEIGKGDIGLLTRLCLHLDRMIGRKIKAKGKVNKNLRYKLNGAIHRLRFRIRCLVDDLHKKVSSLLVNSYKLIFLPTYETSQMVLKATRKINRKSVRNMLTWSFGRFANHLEQAAKRNGVLVIRTNESYTSKTCPHCGKIHHKLGGAKTFKCPDCGFIAPRDWVGAVNNMLAALQAIAFSLKDGVISILEGDVTVAQFREDCEA